MKDQLKHYEDKLTYETDSWDLMVAMSNKENVIVIDARAVNAYEKEHIPGAINLHHSLMDKNTTENIDKKALIVTYCDGIGCNASTKGALKMTKLGFRVKELMGGLDWWKRDGHPTEGSESKSSTGATCGCG
jgi:rhodanese-related sulfurtransferase